MSNMQKIASCALLLLRTGSCLLILLQIPLGGAYTTADKGIVSSLRVPRGRSVLGDPGMKSEKVRVAVEGWNFCNRVGIESPAAPSPRWADCTDINCGNSHTPGTDRCVAKHQVTDLDNNLKTGESFPSGTFEVSNDADLYVVEKEKYLASLCEENSSGEPWHFWMIMLKNGNYDESSSLCRNFAGKPVKFFNPRNESELSAFPCFGPGCMNQPVVFQNWSNPLETVDEGSQASDSRPTLSGSIYGTYDVDQAESIGSNDFGNASYFSVTWTKNETSGSWIFAHKLTVSPKYPWLMLYLRADATSGVSGGYPWETRGMMRKVPSSPNFKVVVTLNVIEGGGRASQFYLIDIGGCWKNSGEACDGNMDTDVTRYVEMIINPQTPSWCRPDNLALCPPYHTAINGTRIPRTDTNNFPYTAYHLYCSPPNALNAEKPFSVCDPFSNPQPQELMQLLPHPEWAVHGYPEKKGDGWVGDPRTWILDVGALSNRLYFYQDPETPPATRVWSSIDVGTEIFNGQQPVSAVWTVSDFDVLIMHTPDY
ncbi:uncharacterized protein [Physcomitrium patens]|uniref:DUF7705 domain-containing protein n=1 Tax=Physcomitrium patens TaxID=3218 RepID=A0A2K1J1A2_PHYPA|nr:uncharacterized protein LOC112295356 isoform X2 [Physcomitrium patens]PNR35303.1 hypothetical protein PHYPA_023203 [Physcomitrium patens]|eukprot:XP_024402608.1 uncharacterized protein LOC112295356 isoform X2 [Physcomitrella patens]